MTDREELTRLLGMVHDAIVDLPPTASAVQLYRDGRDVAEARLPGALGVAVACVLAEAAERRRLAGVAGSLGASEPMMALAAAVLACPA